MGDSLDINSIESLYKALEGRDEIKAKALFMLLLRNWLTEVSSFDPVPGHALHTGIIDFLDAVARSVKDESPKGEIKDRIYQIVSHTKEAALAIMEHPRDKILREHAMLPIHAAREVDSNSVQWLSRQSGRTLREKLSGKPYMKAIRRRSSVDTAENRLLRAFLFRLEQILIERQNVLSARTEETCEELLVSLQGWFRTEDVAGIGSWRNLPPNNILLQDKRYRKVWDGWLRLQNIDEQITGDSERVHRDILSVIYWNTLSLLNISGCFRTVQQPVCLDYDNFSIVPELPVRGFLFPGCNPKIKGKIKNINYEKKFGFLTPENGSDLFFHKNNLFGTLDMNTLKKGDEVSFVMGRNRQGKCADDITLTGGIPINFSLTDDKWEIQIRKEKYLLELDSGSLVIQKNQGGRKNLKLESVTRKEFPSKEISKKILSYVTGLPFEDPGSSYNQSCPVRSDRSIVDLCAIRPILTDNTGSPKHLPFRLLQQIWKLKEGTEHIVDCGRTKAVELSEKIKTISMRSLFSENSSLPDTMKSRASMFFIEKLRGYIKTDKLIYLIPDWGNEFNLEGIRKSINFYFAESTPIPKSIASIFSWQSSKRFARDKVRDNDFVLVVDSFDGGISVTPVQAIRQEKLIKILPETHGICWERHPTIIIPNRSIYTGMVDKLCHNGFQESEELLRLFGFDGLVNDAGEISFVKDKHWYHLPDSIREVLTQDLEKNTISSFTIKDCLKQVKKACQSVSIFILPLDDTIRNSDLGKDYKWLGSTWSPIEGCRTLNRWQEEADDIALWRDHLPELSIRIVRDGRFENFYLVKDATVRPQRGRTVNIPVKESFTLPPGKKHYSFPLQQGEGNKELQFVAYMKSPAFPLKRATVCKLKMTYTYGADDPYELKFIPLDSAEVGFKSIRVEWRSASEDEADDLENLPVPEFPARKSWLEFRKFPKEDSKSFSDLLDWVEKEIMMMSDSINFLIGENSKRIYDNEVINHCNWKEDKKGGQFCLLKYDFGDVFFHENNYEEFDLGAEAVSFYIERNEDRYNSYRAKNVTLGKSVPIDHFRKSLRFPVLTIWNHGHSLTESDVPDQFRQKVYQGIQDAVKILKDGDIPNSLKEEIFFFLCCLHKDAPPVIFTRLLKFVTDKENLKRYKRNIAFAIGTAEISWQQDLLKKVMNLINNNDGIIRSMTLEILSIALWRSKTLINKLTQNEIEDLSRILYGAIEYNKNFLKDKAKNKGKEKTVCKHLELLLALLRSRGLEDERAKMIFTPDNDLTRKYVTLVEDVSEIIISNNIELESRIDLQIEKPEEFHKTPDLLYALRMYLTGDTGADTIVITGIREET